MANKDIDKLVAALRRAGWGLRKTSKNYWIVSDPAGNFVTRIPSTPSSQRTIRRVRATLKNHGFEE